MKLRPELALRERKKPPRRHFGSMFRKCLSLPAPEGCWLTFLSSRSLCVRLRVCLRVKANGKCVFLRVFAPATLSISLQLQIRHTMAGCSSSTLQHGRGAAARLSVAEQRHTAIGRIAGRVFVNYWGKTASIYHFTFINEHVM